MESELITIAAFANALDAEMARGRLESEGITVFILGGCTIGINLLLSNALGGVKLAVKSSDVDRAREVLGERRQLSLDDEGWGACPTCGSRQLELQLNRCLTDWTWLLFGLPLVRQKKLFRCRSCSAETATPNV